MAIGMLSDGTYSVARDAHNGIAIDPVELTTGYMVSDPNGIQIPEATWESISSKSRIEILTAFASTRAVIPDRDAYIGIWTDTETNTVYIDSSEWYSSNAAAMLAGNMQHQIAIWDNANKKEIRL